MRFPFFPRHLIKSERNRGYIFILGHMRSGSSLLVHLLNSNPEIAGFGETHFSYPNIRSLEHLEGRVKEMLDIRRLEERYVLDKILHNYQQLGPEVLSDSRIRFLFLVRHPLATIASAVRQWGTKPDSPWHDVWAFNDYYITRLLRMTELVREIGCRTRCLMVTYEALVQQTEDTFARIERFLELRAPMREDYDVLPCTGKPGIGDPSAQIRTGRLLRKPRADSSSWGVELDDRVVDRYDHACRVLANMCSSGT